MKYFFVNSDTIYTTENFFPNSDSPDNLLLFFTKIKNFIEQTGAQCTLTSEYQGSDPCYIFNEYPRRGTKAEKLWRLVGNDRHTTALISLENKIIRPDVYTASDLTQFNYIFSWDDTFFCQFDSFTKINFSINTAHQSTTPLVNRSKNIVCIAAKKRALGNGENYSLRYRDIKALDRQDVIPFELYGMHWDRPLTNSLYFKKIINYICRRFIRIRPPTCWKGTCSDKSKILNASTFNLCYENASNDPGYITEKILQSIIAGSIPIYLGANDISKYVDPSLYIDRRSFRTIDDLVIHLKNLDHHFFEGYEAKRLNFIRDGGLVLFDASTNAEILSQTICNSPESKG